MLFSKSSDNAICVEPSHVQNDKSMGRQQRRSFVGREPRGRLSQGSDAMLVTNASYRAHAYVCVAKVRTMIRKGAAPNVGRPKVNLAR